MTDWADQCARALVAAFLEHEGSSSDMRKLAASALRRARSDALEEAWLAWKNAGEDAEVGNAIRALKANAAAKSEA
jgi:hypothetical protein